MSAIDWFSTACFMTGMFATTYLVIEFLRVV